MCAKQNKSRKCDQFHYNKIKFKRVNCTLKYDKYFTENAATKSINEQNY